MDVIFVHPDLGKVLHFLRFDRVLLLSRRVEPSGSLSMQHSAFNSLGTKSQFGRRITILRIAFKRL
jgi:hypothetical protein